jgi:hypothetical protein
MASFKCSQNTKSTTLRPRCQLCRKKRSPRSYLSNSGNCTSCENLCRKCGREIEKCECPPKGIGRPRCQLCRKKRSPRSYLSNSGNCTSCENLCRKCGREIEQCECPPKGTDGRKQNVLKKQSQCLPRDHIFIQRLQVEMHQRNKNYIILQNIITTKECLEIRKWIHNSRSLHKDVIDKLPHLLQVFQCPPTSMRMTSRTCRHLKQPTNLSCHSWGS